VSATSVVDSTPARVPAIDDPKSTVSPAESPLSLDSDAGYDVDRPIGPIAHPVSRPGLGLLRWCGALATALALCLAAPLLVLALLIWPLSAAAALQLMLYTTPVHLINVVASRRLGFRLILGLIGLLAASPALLRL
jgi:hypothetical protein